MRIYSKSPARRAQAPGIVVIMHGPGLDKFIEDRVDDLARHGYAAAAPTSITPAEDGADMMARIGRLRDKEIIATPTPPSRIAALKDVRVTNLAVLGFCMGGAHQLSAPARDRRRGARPASSTAATS